jgi:peptidoglycan hydrolase-like protein with peptidoglycan-binding domain
MSLLLLGVLAVAGCSSGGGSSNATTTTSGLVTIPSATTATTATTAAGTPAGTATTAVGLVPGQTATSTAGGSAVTTAASRVVTKPSDNVRLGDTGSGVKQIQTALVAHGYKVATDGAFGPQTSQAVKDFQKKNGLTQDGVVGPVTWAKLQAAPTAATTTVAKTTTTVKATTTTVKT